MEQVSSATLKQAEAYSGMYKYLAEHVIKPGTGHDMKDCLLLLTRNSKISKGYFAKDKWTDHDGNKLDEIAINANHMSDDPVDLLNTLVHEMLHKLQHDVGKPSRPGYHNEEWANWCKACGLEPKGADGRPVGQSMDTHIIPGGLLENALRAMPLELIFPFFADELPDEQQGGGGGGSEPEKPPSHAGKRMKYQCPACATRVWGKPGLSIVCGTCNTAFVEFVTDTPD